MKNLSLVFRSLALPVLLLTLNAAGAQEKQPLRYVDAATLTVIGKSMPTPKLFQRVDTARYELWQPVKNYSAFSTGLAVVSAPTAGRSAPGGKPADTDWATT